MFEIAIIVVLVALVPLVLLVHWLGVFDCDHELIYYDQAGDRLDEVEWGEPCFSKCRKCGEISVIPSAFQSDASFENFLSQREMGGSRALKKVARD